VRIPLLTPPSPLFQPFKTPKYPFQLTPPTPLIPPKYCTCFLPSREWPSRNWLSSFICDSWFYNLYFSRQFGGKIKKSILLSVRTGKSAIVRRTLVHLWTKINQNTSNKIESFDQTVLASGDVSRFWDNKPIMHKVLSFRAYSQWKLRRIDVLTRYE
jgi:hypothetical protein